MVRLSNKRCTQTSTATAQSFSRRAEAARNSRRAEAARNRNKTVCKACSDWHRKCDRRLEAGSTCSFCRKRRIDCVLKCSRKTVPDGPITFVFECKLTGQPETNGLKPNGAEAVPCLNVDGLTSILPPTIGQKQDDAIVTLSPSSDFDLCFSSPETLFHPEDAETAAFFCHNKLRAEIPWEDELTHCDTDAIIKDDLIESWTQSASQETFEFMGVHGQYKLPHLESVFSIERGRDGLLWVWYIFEGLIFVALCDIEWMVVEGPFWCILS